METILSSKYLKSDPGDHVSTDCLGIILYGLSGGFSKGRIIPDCGGKLSNDYGLLIISLHLCVLSVYYQR